MLKEKKISRKKQIELTATELFMSRGYAATSMRDLATALGIEAASLYSHIKSKEEILQKICFRMAEEFFAAIKEIEGKALTAEQKLKAAVHAHLDVITKDTAASAVFFNEWRHLSEPFLGDFLRMREEYEQHFIDIIKLGITNGEFQSIDHKFGMLTIISSLNWVHNWYKPQGKMSIDEIKHELSSTLIEGLKHKKSYTTN